MAPAQCAFALVSVLDATVLSAESQGLPADPVVIEYGDEVVTRAEVDDRFQVAVRLLAHRQGISLADQDPAAIAALRDQYLDKYASELVFLREAERRELAVPGTRVSRELSELLASAHDENEFVDNALLRAVVRDEQTIELLTEAMLQEIRIPPGDVVTMHHDVKDSLATPEEFCVQHIQVDSADAANDIRAKLEHGAEFAQMAAKNSTDAATAGAGGDLGCFERTLSTPRSDFEKAVFVASEGELSGPVESRLGHHIFIVYKHTMSRAPTLDEAYAQIERELALEQLPARLQALVSDSGIDVHADVFRDPPD